VADASCGPGTPVARATFSVRSARDLFARERLAEVFGCPTLPIRFTENATVALNQAIKGCFGRATTCDHLGGAQLGDAAPPRMEEAGVRLTVCPRGRRVTERER